jgi:putative colanic acid biosynthesis acetyltransferase WcaF
VEANHAANRVYEKLGFELLMTASELGKKVHWYGFRLDGQGEKAETLTAEENRTSRGPEPLSYADRLLRKTWVFVSFLLFRFSPAPLHGWRRFLLRVFGAKVGPSARIYPTVSVWAPWNLILGKDACLGYRVNCYNGGIVTLEEGSMVSQDSTLCAATHDYSLSSMPLVIRPITIGRSAWVCAEAFIGPGVTVGEGAVVGARSCVVTDVAPWNVVGGNPARFLKVRTLDGRPIMPPLSRSNEKVVG